MGFMLRFITLLLASYAALGQQENNQLTAKNRVGSPSTEGSLSNHLKDDDAQGRNTVMKGLYPELASAGAKLQLLILNS